MPTNFPSILLVALYGVYPIISFIYIQKFYQKLERNNSKIPVLFLCAFVLLNAVFIAILGLYSYGVWWYLMLPLCLFPSIVGIVGVGRMKKNWEGNNSLKTVNLLFSVLLIVSFLSSPFLSFEIGNLCDSVTRNQAKALISGIAKYKNQQDSYPENLSKVYPTYLEQLPTASCLKPYRLFDKYYKDRYSHYRIEYCEDNSLLMTIRSTDLNSMLIYNFPYHQWLQYESFDYCGCPCPEINKP